MESLDSIHTKLPTVFNFGLRQKNGRNINACWHEIPKSRTWNNFQNSHCIARRLNYTRGLFHLLFYRAQKLGTTRSLIPLRPPIFDWILKYQSWMLCKCLLNFCGAGARFSKVISADIILFVSSRRRRLEARNFAVILIFVSFNIPYVTTSFTE